MESKLEVACIKEKVSFSTLWRWKEVIFHFACYKTFRILVGRRKNVASLLHLNTEICFCQLEKHIANLRNNPSPTNRLQNNTNMLLLDRVAVLGEWFSSIKIAKTATFGFQLIIKMFIIVGQLDWKIKNIAGSLPISKKFTCYLKRLKCSRPIYNVPKWHSSIFPNVF